MKHGGVDHPKILDLGEALAENLGIGIELAETLAVGLVEKLIHRAKQYALRGDIGRLSNKRIARMVGWTGDADWLVEALLDAGLVDRSEDPEVRLVLHDWSEHAEDSVHNAIARKREYFADGCEPKLTRLPPKERPDIAAFYGQRNDQSSPSRSENVSRALQKRTDTPRHRHVIDTPQESASAIADPPARSVSSSEPETDSSPSIEAATAAEIHHRHLKRWNRKCVGGASSASWMGKAAKAWSRAFRNGWAESIEEVERAFAYADRHEPTTTFNWRNVLDSPEKLFAEKGGTRKWFELVGQAVTAASASRNGKKSHRDKGCYVGDPDEDPERDLALAYAGKSRGVKDGLHDSG